MAVILVVLAGSCLSAHAQEGLCVTDVFVRPRPATVQVYIFLNQTAECSWREVDTQPGVVIEIPGAAIGVQTSSMTVNEAPISKIDLVPASETLPARIIVLLSHESKWKVWSSPRTNRVIIEIEKDRQAVAALSQEGADVKSETPIVSKNASATVAVQRKLDNWRL